MSLQDALIIVLIASVMLSMGLALKPQNLWQAIKHPKPLLLILGINILLLPVIGWCLGQGLSAEMALALLLAGACGIGSTAPLFTANVRGDIALATAAMVINGFICLLTLPFTLAMAGFELESSAVALSDVALNAFYTLALWQVLPLLLGMLVHRLWEAAALVWAKRFKTLGNATLALLIVGITVTQGHLFLTLSVTDLAVMALLVLATYLLPFLFRSQQWGSTLVFCTSTRNLNLALLLASQVFASDALLLTILSYSAVMYILLLPFTVLLNKRAYVD
ncbi:MAG: bile acid:sodium symporter [Gammaproteobacteria bacterium]|nr:bile acid:sodium symporter [Gammaproteobacteria bacterium]